MNESFMHIEIYFKIFENVESIFQGCIFNSLWILKKIRQLQFFLEEETRLSDSTGLVKFEYLLENF